MTERQTLQPLQIKVSTVKGGQRQAVYFSSQECRWWPLRLEDAETLLAFGFATEYHPAGVGA